MNSFFITTNEKGMDSHDRRRVHSISDLYFYSELSKKVGLKESEQWLQTSAVQKSKWMQNRTVQNRSSLSAPPICSSSCSTPSKSMSSCQDSDDDSLSELGHLVAKEMPTYQRPDSISFEAKDRFSSLGFVSGKSFGCYDDILAISDADAMVFPSKLGLLFTDAAHSVLEDRDLGFYLRRWNSALF